MYTSVKAKLEKDDAALYRTKKKVLARTGGGYVKPTVPAKK